MSVMNMDAISPSGGGNQSAAGMMSISPDLNDLSDWNFDGEGGFGYGSTEDCLLGRGQI